MSRLYLAISAVALVGAPLFAQSASPGQTPSSPAVSDRPAQVHQPKIHIVEVVDESGCKGLNGGLASGGGALLGGLLGFKLKAGSVGTKVASEAGKEAGNQIDRSARCTQTINIEPGLGQ